MAQVKYGAIITEIKGKVGGSVFQSSNAGFSMKNKGRMKTGDVTLERAQDDLQRTNFSIVTKAWQGLTDTERASWNGLLGVWTFTNKFGEVYNGSGYQIFCAANLNRLSLGLSLLQTAPVENPMVDPMVTYTDYSISGVFEETRSNAAAIGSTGFLYVSFPTKSTQNYKKVRRAGSLVREYLSVGTTSRKAEIQFLLGGNPPIGSVLYGVIWWCFPDYPKAQFFTVFKVDVVA